MKFNPYKYQRRGVEWIKARRRCALFWEMGLGKSVVTLTALADLMDGCEVERVLVVAPKKVAESTWAAEADKWDHLAHLRVVKVMGTAKQRETALTTDADIYVMGRDSVVWLWEQCKGHMPFDTVVLDELTSFKTPSSQRSKIMRKMCEQVHRVIGLTGTPAPNGLVDLWGQLYCIDKGERLGKSVTKYRDTYFTSYVWNNIPIRYTIKPGAEKVIRDKIADICLTMQAADYLTLPPLTVTDHKVELPKNIAEGYRLFERDRIMEIAAEVDTSNAVVMASSAAALMNKLSQYANGALYDEDHMWHEIHNEKLDHLMEIVEAAGRGVLVFYQYKHDAERILKAIGKDYSARIYKGDADLRAWNAGSVDVMLAHPASTAYGLNMQQGGNYIVWFGTGWDLELYQQANARLYRQGQTKHVHVIRLIVAGTVDERAAAALTGKSGQQQALIDGLKAMLKAYERSIK